MQNYLVTKLSYQLKILIGISIYSFYEHQLKKSLLCKMFVYIIQPNLLLANKADWNMTKTWSIFNDFEMIIYLFVICLLPQL